MKGKMIFLAFLFNVLALVIVHAELNGYRMTDQSPVYCLGNCPEIDLTDEISLEAWIRPEKMGPGGGRIIDKSRPGTQEAYLLDTYPGNSLRFLNINGSCTFKTNLAPNQWYHIVAVYSAPKKVMKLYLNGTEVAHVQSGEFSRMIRNNAPLCIGADPDGGNKFNGQIREIVIYNRALTADEVLGRYNATENKTLTGVVADWIFPENPGRSIKSVVGSLELRPFNKRLSIVWNGKITGEPKPPTNSLTLWYKKPASEWVEALPIGNGRLGAMVFGGIGNERLQLNEDTLWAGGPYDPANPEALAALPEARRLIFEGKYREAQRLIDQKMMAKPLRQMPYQTLGDLWLEFPETDIVDSYIRSLNLDTAVAEVQFTQNNTRYKREIFSSPVDNVIVLRLSASDPGKVSFNISFKTPQNAIIFLDGNDTLVMRGTNASAQGIKGVLKFEARAKIINSGGQVKSEQSSIGVINSDEAILIIAAATSYKNYKDVTGDPEKLVKTHIANAVSKGYMRLLNDHITEHQRLFRRVNLDLGSSQAEKLPTDERIKNFMRNEDPSLPVLYFQFGRYLLISSSRPGCQPANLQGIWNESMSPPWESKYTININTEMNYWPAESCNLSECAEPLFQMVKDLAQTGARTAEIQYGARGWVAHHNTDLWRATAPIDGASWGFWPMGGAWLTLHLWDHYQYTLDKNFLTEMYPILKGAVEFFMDALVEDPKYNYLVTCPSLSPENSHPFGSSICAGPYMDTEILRDLFGAFIESSKILGCDENLRLQVESMRNKLAPFKIGKGGQLQEWLEDWDLDAPDIHHRHVSHLYAVFPSAQITLRRTPDLAEAAKKTLELRGDMSTGWSLAWKINLWARLGDGNRAFKLIKMLLEPSRTYPNMFDAHPPFQIDGNFGGTSGICEMLMQSHTGEIELLPALPDSWKKGSVSGLRARGGFEVSMNWDQGRLQQARIKSISGTACVVRYADKIKLLTFKPGEEKSVDF